MNPQFPIYIPSKGRWGPDRGLTMRYLTAMGVPFRVIVEAPEADFYSWYWGKENILVLDPAYQRDYNTCDSLGDTKSKGSGPARNFIWDHAVASGAAWHWIMDDNIRGFFRFNHNTKKPFADGTLFRVMEDFCLRFANVGMAGPSYVNFSMRKEQKKALALNTRIFSCNLIRNDVPMRWRGRYNEDLDLSLRMLKASWCTVQFSAFQQQKVATQRIRGGNTDELYKHGTLEKSEMIARLHPDVARVVKRYNRIHHYVDYRAFKKLRLILRPGIEWPSGVDDFGLELKDEPFSPPIDHGQLSKKSADPH